MFKIGKFGKKVVAAVIAYSIVFGTLVWYPTEKKSRVFAATNVLDYDSASSVNYNTILGRATDYGLLVGTMNQTGHMETTFATNKYIGETNNDVDLAGEAPSNIIIASVEPGSHPVFGKTRSSVFNIYTTEAIANIIEFDSQFNKGAAAFEGQTPPSYSGSPTVNFHYQTETDLTENVNKMLEHTKQQSDMLAAKPSVDVSKLLKNGNVLDLSSEEYKGATIYIDVPAGSTIETLLRGADDLTIKKYPSTNVVFNLRNTNLTINKFKVEVLNDDGTTKKTITSGDQQHSGNYSEHDADIEEYICKNIIFNAPNATKAKVMNTAGLFLFPQKADIIVNAAGGWLATPGKVTTEGEWHFFYQGRSKDINTSEKASFHFAAYKAFTTEFRGENTERLTNIYAGKDEYTFSFTETGSDYDTTGLTGTTVKTDENGYLFFPSLSVNIADVDPLNPQYHYYVIKETAVSSSSGMDAPSNGEMRMKVKVENNSGVIKFTIDHVTYLDSNHNEPKNVYKEEAGIVMSGTEFSLGAFINKVTIDKAKLSVTKEVYIDGNKAGADNATVRDAEFKYYLKKGNQYVQDLQGKLGGNPHEFKIKNGKIDKFENLNLGEYVIEEIKPGDLTGLDYSGNSITYVNATSNGSTVTLAKDDNATATLRNDYTTVTITNNHSLQITKSVTGLNPSYNGKEYKVSVKTTDGRFVQSLNGTIDTAEHYFTVKAGETIRIINLPSGGYVISEDTQDARVINYDLTSSVTPDYVDISDTTPNASVEIKNDYTQQKGKLAIRKTFNISNPVTANLKFVITGPDNYSEEVEYIQFTNGEYTIPADLPCGVYTVSEVGADGTAPVGYFYFKTYSGMNNPTDDSTECTVTVSNNQTVTAAFNNLYNEQQYGDLTVHKFVQTVGNISGIPDSFRIAIINSDGKYYDPESSTATNAVFTASPTYCTITTVNGNGTFTASHLPAGSYRLIENRDGTEVAGAVLAVTGEGSVHVIGDQGNHVNLSNTYTMYKLTVRKQASNSPYTGNTYQIAVKKGDSYVQADGSMNSKVHYFDITANGSMTIPVQQSGTYEVFEKNENNSENNFYELVTTYKVGDGEAASTHPSIEFNDTNTSYDVTVINSYTRKTTKGYIDLTKTIKGDVTEEDLKKLTFTVKDADGNTVATLKLGDDFEKVPGSGEGTKGTYKLKEDKLIEVEDTSKTYTVEETLHTLTGFDVTVKHKIGGGSETDGATATVTDVSTDRTKPTEVDFSNAYERIKGELKVAKALNGITGNSSDSKVFTFKVKVGDNEGYLQADGTVGSVEYAFTVTPSEVCKVPVDYSAFGKALTVTEYDTDRDISGYVFNSVGYSDNNGTVTISAKTDNKTVTITNFYKKDTKNGSIILTKTIKGPVTEEDLSNGIKGIQFEIWEEGNTTTPYATLTLGSDFAVSQDADGNPVYTKTITGLDTDKNYTVKETKYTVEGYTVTQTYKIGTATGITPETEAFRPTVSGTAIDYENNYTRIKGELKVTKALSGITGSTRTFTFYVKCGTQYIQADGTLGTSRHPFTVTTSGACKVPVDYAVFGKTLTVEEDTTDSNVAISGYDFAGVSYSSNNGTVTVDSATDEKTVSITNTYEEQTTKGYITLTKTITGLNGENVSGMTFTVKDAAGKTVATKTLADFTLNDGVYTLNAAIEVPDSTATYTVVESSNTVTGYENPTVTYKVGATSGSGATATVTTASTDSTKPTTVAFTNAYKKTHTGSLVISKTITIPDGAKLSDIGNIVFTISPKIGETEKITLDPDNPSTGWTVNGTKFTYTFTGLKQGDKYTVTETSDGSNDTYEVTVTPTDGKRENIEILKDDSKDTSVTASFDNAYSKKQTTTYKGSLVISKTITLPADADLSAIGNIVFTISPKIGETEKITLDPDNPGTGWTANGNTFTYTFEGLTQGEKYTVTETSDGSNSTYEVKVTPDDGKREVEIRKSTTENTSVTAEFANEYSKKQTTTYKGSLVISKTITLPADADLSAIGNIVFTISPKIGETEKITLDPDNPGTGWTANGNTFTYTFKDLTQGEKYTVTETSDGSNSTYEVKVTPDGGKREVEIRKSTTENTSVTAEFANEYSKKQTTTYKGSLVISKTITLPDGAKLSDIGNIVFTISPKIGETEKITLNPDNPGTGWTANGNTFTYTFKDLTQGEKYTVTETSDGSNSTYEVSVTPDGGKREVEIRKSTTENTSVIAEFANEYSKKQTTVYTGSLVITKKITLPSGAKLSDIENIVFTISPKIGDIEKITLDPDNPGDGWEANGNKFTYKFTGLTQGVTYTVTETSDGSNDTYEVSVTPDGGKCEVEIPKSTTENTSVTAEFGNVYTNKTPVPVPTGSIKVTKEEKGEDPDGKPSSYSFYVKCGDKYVKADRTLGSKSDAEKFTVKPGTSGTEVTGLILGKTYTIEEAGFDVPSGYTCSTTYTASSSVALDESNKTASVKITNTYISTGKPSAGSLKVTKKVTGSVASSGMPKEYEFVVKCGDKFVQGDGTLGDDEYVFKVEPNKSVTITGLDTENQKYEVVEKAVTGLPDGYKLSKVSYSPENATVEFNDPEDSGSVIITNNYTHTGDKPTPVTGKLKIMKALNSGAPSSASSKTYKFTVKGNGVNKTVSVKGAKSVTIDDLMPGEYSVTELRDGIEIASYTLKVSGEGIAEVKAGETTSIKITNTYKTTTEYETGKLTVKKTAKDQNNENVNRIFYFTVQDKDGKYLQGDNTFVEDNAYEFAVETGKSVTFTDLAVGEYTVKEITDPDKVNVENYEFLSTSTTDGTGIVTSDKDATVTLANKYKNTSVQPDTGVLKVTKVAKDQNNENVSRIFYFTVQDKDGKYLQSDKTTFLADKPCEFAVETGKTETFEDLPVGSYTVKEITDSDKVNVENYEFLSTSTTEGTGTVTKTETAKSTVTLKNNYKNTSVQPDTGVLKVTKTAKDQNGDDVSRIFYFTVQDKDGKYLQSDKTTFLADKPCEFAVEAGKTETFEDLPVGSYTVKEITDSDKVNVENYEFLSTSTTEGTGTVTKTETAKSTVTLKNDYKKTSVQPDTGSLIVKKTVVDTNNIALAISRIFYFTVQDKDGKYLQEDKATFLADKPYGFAVDAGASFELKDLPLGEYTVTEKTGQDYVNVENYTFVLDKSTASGTGVVTKTVTAKSTVTLKNVYEKKTVQPDTGNLSFSKTFEGDVYENEAAAAQNIYFIIERTDAPDANKYLKADGTFTSDSTEAHIKLSDLTLTVGSKAWKKDFSDIPVGKYKVTEYNYSNDVKIEGTDKPFIYVDGSTSVSTTVTETTPGSLELTNTYKLPGYDVKISKQDIAKKELPKATLTLTSLDGYDMSGAVVKQGSKKITVKVSSDKKSISFVTGTTPSLVTGLKYGNYELKETVTPEAYLTADAIKFSIDRAGNIRDENGSVIVSGSPIVMIDRADPNYKKKNSVPATGVGTSPTNVIGAAVLALSAACCAGIIIYHIRKKRYM